MVLTLPNFSGLQALLLNQVNTTMAEAGHTKETV